MQTFYFKDMHEDVLLFFKGKTDSIPIMFDLCVVYNRFY